MNPSDDLLRSQLYVFLNRHHVLNMSYIAAGAPAACAVWFATTEALTMYYVSSFKTHHGSTLKSGGQVAFTVQKDDQDWRLIMGVQGKGYCTPVTPEQRNIAWETYSKRFPFVIQPFADLAQALSAITLWSIRPTWLRLIDNTKGFGHKEELHYS
jgi:uncharacterized protein YhbP (UPF0306 family)